MNTKHLLSNQTIRIGISIILVFILLFPLFSTASPSSQTGQPWKVEFLSALFLFITAIIFYKKTSYKENLAKLLNKQTRIVLTLLISFVIMSGISAFWADSISSVAHHTFLWINYLLFFVLALLYLKSEKSYQLFISLFVLLASILFTICLIDYFSFPDLNHSVGKIRIRYAKFAELLLIFTPLLWGLTHVARNKKVFALLLIAGSFGWLTIMLSLSKGALIAGVTCFAFLFIGTIFFAKPQFRKRAIYLAVFWLALTIGTQAFFTYASSVPTTTNYIAGKSENKRTSSHFRIFTWKITAQMISDNPLIGVGADNFAVNINDSRQEYVVKNPQDINNSSAEDYMIERSHNEFLQIIAELGIVGFLIFLSILGFLFIWIIRAFIKNKYKFSPLLFGSIAGITAFLISSQFSSFSFRAAQNGILFFIILAITINELSKLNKKDHETIQTPATLKPHKLAFTSAILLLLVGTISFGTQGLSNHYLILAQNERDLSEAEKHIQKAILFNKDNASAYFTYGQKLYFDQRYAEAIPYLRNTVDKELGVTLIYYYLARSQQFSGDKSAAEKTLVEALKIYPNSIYVRTHYAYLLAQNGKTNEAEIEYELANKLDAKEAISWKIMFNENLLNATLEAHRSKNSIEPRELSNLNVVFAMYAEEKAKQHRKKNKVSKK